MSECIRCQCGWHPLPERAAYKRDCWLVMCHHCDLRTREYKTEEEAVKAWNSRRLTRASKMLQIPLTKDKMDDNGAIYLAEGIYHRAVLDYEEALEHPEEVKEYSDKHWIQIRKEVENLFKKGYYLDYRPGEKGIKILNDRIEERKRLREEARKKAAEEAKKKEALRKKLARLKAKEKSRKMQVS